MRHREELRFEPAAPGTTATVFDCALCGLAFAHGDQACSGCALGAGCLLVRCPRCGYQFPRGSLLAAFGGRVLRWLGSLR
jgi:hypothetical protein